MTPVPPASGWFASPPQITVTPAGAPDVDVSIDGSAPEPYTGPFTPAGLASGSHVVTAAASDGGSASVVFRLDVTSPNLSVNLTPPANAAGWRNAPVTASYLCTDAHSGVATCPDPQSTGAQEGAAIVLSGTTTDRVGRSTTVTSSVKVDLTPPEQPAVTLDPPSRDVDADDSDHGHRARRLVRARRR